MRPKSLPPSHRLDFLLYSFVFEKVAGLGYIAQLTLLLVVTVDIETGIETNIETGTDIEYLILNTYPPLFR